MFYWWSNNIQDLTVSGPSASLTLQGSSAVLGANIALANDATFNSYGDYTIGNLSTQDANGSTGTANVTGSLTAKDITGTGLVNVGNKSTKGTLSADSVTGATIFADPAWKNGGTINDASAVAVKTATTTKLIAGQNSNITVGTTDTTWLSNTLSRSHLTWGEEGYTAAFGLTAAHVVGGTGSLVVDGSLTSAPSTTANAANTATFGANSLFVLDAKAANGTDYALQATNVNVDATSSLFITNTGAIDVSNGNATLNIASSDSSGGKISGGGWVENKNTSNVILNNALLSGTVANANNTVQVNVSLVTDVQSVLPGIDNSLGNLLLEATKRGATGPAADFVNSASIYYGVGDVRNAPIIEGLAKISVLAGSYAHMNAVSFAHVGNIQNRTSLGGTALANSGAVMLADSEYFKQAVANSSNLVAMAVNDTASGKMRNGFALWVQPMYQSTNADGFKTGTYEYGYDSDLFGVSLGADYTFMNNMRLGAALNIGSGSSESTGNFARTKNDFDYLGFSLYGGYLAGNFGLLADIGYTVTDNEVHQDTVFGRVDADDYDSSLFTAGLRAEYKIPAAKADFIPYAGIRVNHFSVDDFNTKQNGNNIFLGEDSSATTVAFPIGVIIQKDINTESGMKVTPSLALGAQFTAGDTDIDQTVRLAGVNTSATMESEIFDPVTFQGGLGLDIENNNINFALDYKINASSNATSHGVMATFTFKF